MIWLISHLLRVLIIDLIIHMYSQGRRFGLSICTQALWCGIWTGFNPSFSTIAYAVSKNSSLTHHLFFAFESASCIPPTTSDCFAFAVSCRPFYLYSTFQQQSNSKCSDNLRGHHQSKKVLPFRMHSGDHWFWDQSLKLSKPFCRI